MPSSNHHIVSHGRLSSFFNPMREGANEFEVKIRGSHASSMDDAKRLRSVEHDFIVYSLRDIASLMFGRLVETFCPF